MSHEVWMQSTPYEMRRLLEAIRERETVEAKAANRRAGLIASTLVNLLAKTSKQWQPDDWWDYGDERGDVNDDPKDFGVALRMWAESVGAKVET